MRLVPESLLEFRDVRSGFGEAIVLDGISFRVPANGSLAVLGRNGVGKTTCVHAVMGMVRPTGGSVRFDGVELAGRPPHAIARRGLALVPQGRRVFSPLTVEENLRIARRGSNGWTLDRVYELLPRLAERRRHRGDQLSGGEQQMVAIGRALLGNPRLILLDEPSDGLAPLVVRDIVRVLAELRAQGLAALLVEQDLRMALELSDAVCIMSKGEIVYRAPTAEFRREPGVARSLLGIGSA